MRLFDVSNEIESILAGHYDPQTGEEQGEFTEETLARLNALEMEADRLLLDLAAYHLGELAEAEAVDEVIARLRRRKEVHERRAQWLKDVVQRNLAAGRKLTDGRLRIGWRRSSAVLVHDPNKIPEDLQRVIPESREPDKAAIKAAIQSGREVPGAEIDHRQNVSIQ